MVFLTPADPHKADIEAAAVKENDERITDYRHHYNNYIYVKESKLHADYDVIRLLQKRRT